LKLEGSGDGKFNTQVGHDGVKFSNITQLGKSENEPTGWSM
jgi:hypothetical protein